MIGNLKSTSYKNLNLVKCILLDNFYVCGPTSMTLILYLVSKVNKVESQNSGQGPITLGVMSLGRFSKFKIHFA